MSNEIFLLLITMFVMIPGTIIIPVIVIGFLIRKLKNVKDKIRNI